MILDGQDRIDDLRWNRREGNPVANLPGRFQESADQLWFQSDRACILFVRKTERARDVMVL